MIQGLKDWLYLFNSGQDFQSYNRFGAHEVEPGKWSFLVWAPHAQQVNVEGDFNDWQGSPLKLQGTTGCWYGELAAEKNQLYKYRIIGPDGIAHEKIDPYGFGFERKPGSAAKLVDVPRITWHDEDWLAKRAKWRPYDEPLNIYEVHLGSFIRDTNAGPDGGYMTYQDAIDKLIPYVQELGYTHIEFLPLMEHPLDASWGYQLMGYFAPTSRFGDPQDFLRLVDAAHTAGLGVIMDWVPGHFIKNTDMLAQFDGTPTFEYTDPHRAENVRWGTWNFDLGKAQVQSFLISSAMYWLDHCHLDGLRVDAVSNMLYMDFDAGKENDRNKDGGRDNLEGIAFIKQLN
ncbi:MAG: 1,4-alpha-glucan branching enzyme, partial [Lacticaseibacillus paracasei]|nr:1,4-alpha-glucan branching enzyme [Lacticaseibacillus paracasei]